MIASADPPGLTGDADTESGLQVITRLSHEFGTPGYVRGGGGNSSAKDKDRLWVKPSGISLAEMTPEAFISLDRRKLSTLYTAELPSTIAEREAEVTGIVKASVVPGSTGRPSVEAPLHDSLSARFIVHTHPPIVNGMTCAVDGALHAGRLFPEALWIDYTDPGYSLCMKVRAEVAAYRDFHGYEPPVIFIGNHGVFVAADEPDHVREIYRVIFTILEGEYHRAGIPVTLAAESEPPPGQLARYEELIRSARGDTRLNLSVSGLFSPADGPLTPDHIVYAGAAPFVDEPSAEGFTRYRSEHGHQPKIALFEDAVIGMGESRAEAVLAIEIAQDAALVVQLAGAFGGIRVMDERSRRFIEGWEVETYRQMQVSSADGTSGDPGQEA